MFPFITKKQEPNWIALRKLSVVFQKIHVTDYAHYTYERKEWDMWDKIWTTNCKVTVEDGNVLVECFKYPSQAEAKWINKNDLRWPECP